MMSFDDIKIKIQELSNKVFQEAGMDLVDLKITGHKNDIHIEITADKPSGGINIRECAILNKALVALIEQENFLPPEIFSLELSSPGLDRPLVTRKDFMRVIGQELYIWLNDAVAGKKEVQGILTELSDSSLTIITTKKIKLDIPLAKVIKGILYI